MRQDEIDMAGQAPAAPTSATVEAVRVQTLEVHADAAGRVESATLAETIAVAVEAEPPLKVLALIDGANFMFRAYHATKASGLSAPDGTPTAALTTFANMVKKAKALAGASAVAIIFESTTGTFRDDLVDDYKANRKETPSEVKVQMNLARDLFPLMGVPVIWSNGFEADDVLCAYGADPGPGWRVAMCSSDKDLGQVIGEKAFQIIPDGWLVIDEARLREKIGVGPEMVTQYLALMGDNVDNIEGVKLCGKKTAAKLLNKYGSIDEIYANIDALTPALKAGFQEAKPRMPVLMELTTAALNAPRPLTPDQILAANHSPDWDGALGMLRPLAMAGLIARAEKGKQAMEAKAARLGAMRP